MSKLVQKKKNKQKRGDQKMSILFHMSGIRVFVTWTLALGKNAVCPNEKDLLKLYYIY